MSWQLSKQCFWHLGNMHLVLLYQMNFKICLLSDKFINITKRRLIQTTNIDSNSSQKFLKRTWDLKTSLISVSLNSDKYFCSLLSHFAGVVRKAIYSQHACSCFKSKPFICTANTKEITTKNLILEFGSKDLIYSSTRGANLSWLLTLV